MAQRLYIVLVVVNLFLYIDPNAAVSLDVCNTFMSTRRQELKSQFYGDRSQGYFSQFITRDNDYELLNVIKFNVLGPVYENNETVALCVGFHDTTSYTKNVKKGSKEPIAWVTLNTDPNIATGLVLVDAECWTDKRDLAPCNPVFWPMASLTRTPLYVHSPLSRQFWSLLQDEHLFANKWVWRMNTQSNEETFPSSWVSNMSVRNLRELQIKGNDWGRPVTLLTSHPSLERLDLTDNNIEEMPADILANTPRLQDMILAKNNLSVFPDKLAQLKHLRLLDITNPKGSAELTISADDLSSLKRVKILGLENVNLNTNVTGLLSLQQLTFLNLSGCGIDHIGDITSEVEIGTDERSLMNLDLSKNDLIALPSKLFSLLKKLKSLRLQANKLETCPKESLKELHELDYLDLSANRISQVTKHCFEHLYMKLEYLDLSGNKLSILPEDTFESLLSLKTLKLDHNKLSIILPLTFFNPNRTNTYLDISNNYISEWTVVTSMRHLNLSYNRINKFSDIASGNLYGNDVIDLGGNSFDCCDGSLKLLKLWIEETGSDIRNLGTKNLLECLVPGDNERYLIRTFEYERELCRNSDEQVDIDTVYEYKDAWDFVHACIGAVLTACILILIITMLALLRYYCLPNKAKTITIIA